MVQKQSKRQSKPNMVVVPSTVFASAILLLMMGVAVVILGRHFVQMLGLVLAVVAFIDAASIVTLKITLYSRIEKEGIRVRYGFARRVNVLMPWKDFRNANVYQSWLGKRFGYGSVILLGKRFGVRIQHIKNPWSYLEAIQSQRRIFEGDGEACLDASSAEESQGIDSKALTQSHSGQG